MKLHEIVAENKCLGEALDGSRHKIRVLANVTINPVKELLEYQLRRDSINAVVSIGDYDNIVQDSANCADFHTVIVILELRNLFNGFGMAAEALTRDELDATVRSVKDQINLTLRNLADVSQVFVSQLSTASYDLPGIGSTVIDEIVEDINDYVRSCGGGNVIIIDVDKVVARVGAASAYDMRFFYASRAPYTLAYLEELVFSITPAILAKAGSAKKVLVLDCDNTLWSGVLGEEGTTGIKMSYQSSVGAIFSDIQSLVCGLASRGVIICLCSKNNLADVQDIIDHHPDMKINDDIIAVKKINWDDKASNIVEIANELNLGLDSIVFLDDSDFEVNLVKSRLPEITVLQVPKKLHDYPDYFARSSRLFFNPYHTSEDKSKSSVYKDQGKRNTERQKFTNVKDYLRSLEMQACFRLDPVDSLERVAQLTNKTNQFNLTTKRYSEGDISKYMLDPDVSVLTVNVADKFGDQGLVGVVILCACGEVATIDTFLMSCRVIGRDIELVIVDTLVNLSKLLGIKKLNSSYNPTLKNVQVSNFYEICGFEVSKEQGDARQYELLIEDYRFKEIEYVRVINEFNSKIQTR